MSASHATLQERTLLRALIDLPEFAQQVIPAVDADLFGDESVGAIYTLIADGYRSHKTAPDFNILRVRNGSAPGPDWACKAGDALIGDLESMPPIPPAQLPLLMTDAEKWIRGQRVHRQLIAIAYAEEDGTDPRPLADKLKAAYDWRFSDTPTGRYAFKSREDLLNSSTASFLVQNLLVQNSLVALVSPPGSNKTFLALDLALSVASGQSTWLNERLNLSGPVVYVLGEGGGRFKLRLRAWDEQHGITDTYPFHYVNEPVALTKATDANAFVREVAACKPVLIVFDTLSRCLAGADENNQRDMSSAVAVCDALRQQLGCCVLLLHHTTKDGATERGSSVLKGAVDTMVVLKVKEPTAPDFVMTCEKQKDAEPFAPIALVREVVTLASERDPHTGEPAVSCVVKVASASHVMQQGDKRLWKAKQFMVTHPDANKTDLASHMGVRRTDALGEIDRWVSEGHFRFRRKRRSDALASSEPEQTAVTVPEAGTHQGSG
jgi:hypothetical protein